MTDQLALPFVSIVGASPSAPPEAFAEVRRPRRAGARKRLPPVADRGSETPPQVVDDESTRLDVHEYLVHNGEATFFFEVHDDAMASAEIFDGDMLVVDKSLQPAHGSLVVAYVNGERLVRRLYSRGKKTALQADDAEIGEIVPEYGSELIIWGVVIGMFKRFVG